MPLYVLHTHAHGFFLFALLFPIHALTFLILVTFYCSAATCCIKRWVCPSCRWLEHPAFDCNFGHWLEYISNYLGLSSYLTLVFREDAKRILVSQVTGLWSGFGCDSFRLQLHRSNKSVNSNSNSNLKMFGWLLDNLFDNLLYILLAGS